jgi:hypothetical protein
VDVSSRVPFKRIAAVRALEALGYGYRNGEWQPPAAVAGAAGAPLPFTVEADAMHGMLMLRADALAGCTESSDEETELQAIVVTPPRNETSGKADVAGVGSGAVVLGHTFPSPSDGPRRDGWSVSHPSASS